MMLTQIFLSGTTNVYLSSKFVEDAYLCIARYAVVDALSWRHCEEIVPPLQARSYGVTNRILLVLYWITPNGRLWLSLPCPCTQVIQRCCCRRPQFASRWIGNTIATSAILRIKSIEYYQFCIECNQTSVVDWPYQLPLLGACSDSIVTAACVVDEAKLLGIARSYDYLSLLGTISMYDVVRHATPFGCR